MKHAGFSFGLLLALCASSAQAQAELDIGLGTVSVPNDANTEVALTVSGNGSSRGLQIRLDFDDAPIVDVDLDDCLTGFVGLGQPGTRCSRPPGQPGTVRILLNAGPGQAINDFTGVLRFQLDGSLPAGSGIALTWDQPFASATNPEAPTLQTDGEIQITGQAPGALALAPSAIDFGDVEFGSVAYAVLTATNPAPASSTSVEIADILLGGDAGFELTGSGGCTVGTVLEPQGAGCDIEIAFEPGTVESSDGALTVVSTSGQVRQSTLEGQGMPAPADVILSDLLQVFTGTPLSPTVATDPPGLPVTLSYDGGAEPPVAPGIYTVEAVVSDPRYSGQSSALFEILGDEILRDRFEAQPPITIERRRPPSP
ncbi:MAG: hypothetical protein GVY32_11385 [Gammaproteobacteria bacterium]|jgi:hypothetical protein|nr:hypothetical protein [Gammaproteobacteria bacterium]